MKSIKKFILLGFLIISCGIAFVIINTKEDGNLSIVIEDAHIKPGETASVDIYIKDNPGFSSLKFYVDYSDLITLTDIQFNDICGDYATASEPFASPQSISIISPLQEIKENDLLLTLTFQVPNDVKLDETTIRLVVDEENLFDEEMNAISYSVKEGKIIIETED